VSADATPRTLGLVVHPSKAVGESVRTIVRWAGDHGLRIVAREQDRRRVSTDVGIVTAGEFAVLVDGVVALGGDGTMLGAMRLVAARPVPILGVNHGNLGFLVEVTPPQLEAALAKLVAGDYTIEPHSCLVADAPGSGLRTRFGFNDVVLARLGRHGTVSVDLTVNGQQYGYYTCDALVVCTPSGSTAYNYAAGGPVLSPSAAAMAVTPVAPMAGVARTVVLGTGDEAGLRVPPGSGRVAVDVDGTAAGELAPGETLSVRLRDDAAQVVRLSAGAHASRSRIKLSLLDLPVRRDQLLELIPEKLRHRIEHG
jgi:NAD+ kinase